MEWNYRTVQKAEQPYLLIKVWPEGTLPISVHAMIDVSAQKNTMKYSCLPRNQWIEEHDWIFEPRQLLRRYANGVQVQIETQKSNLDFREDNEQTADVVLGRDFLRQWHVHINQDIITGRCNRSHQTFSVKQEEWPMTRIKGSRIIDKSQVKRVAGLNVLERYTLQPAERYHLQNAQKMWCYKLGEQILSVLKDWTKPERQVYDLPPDVRSLILKQYLVDFWFKKVKKEFISLQLHEQEDQIQKLRQFISFDSSLHLDWSNNHLCLVAYADSNWTFQQYYMVKILIWCKLLKRIDIVNAGATFRQLRENIVPKQIWFGILLYELMEESSLCMVSSWTTVSPETKIGLREGKLQIQICGIYQVRMWISGSSDIPSNIQINLEQG